MQTEGSLPNLLYEATIKLIPKPNKDKDREFQTNFITNIDAQILHKKTLQTESKNTSKHLSIMIM